jgi:hypothetical protein
MLQAMPYDHWVDNLLEQKFPHEINFEKGYVATCWELQEILSCIGWN